MSNFFSILHLFSTHVSWVDRTQKCIKAGIKKRKVNVKYGIIILTTVLSAWMGLWAHRAIVAHVSATLRRSAFGQQKHPTWCVPLSCFARRLDFFGAGRGTGDAVNCCGLAGMIVQLHVADGGVYGVFILRARVCVCFSGGPRVALLYGSIVAHDFYKLSSNSTH